MDRCTTEMTNVRLTNDVSGQTRVPFAVLAVGKAEPRQLGRIDEGYEVVESGRSDGRVQRTPGEDGRAEAVVCPHDVWKRTVLQHELVCESFLV